MKRLASFCKKNHVLVIFLLSLIIFFLIVSNFWFNQGSIINYGDGRISYGKNFINKTTFLWDIRSGGVPYGRKFSQTLLFIPFYLILLLTGSLIITEKIIFALLLASGFTSIYYLLDHIFRKKYFPNIIGSIIYICSFYQFMIWHGLHFIKILPFLFLPIVLARLMILLESEFCLKNIVIFSLFTIPLNIGLSNISIIASTYSVLLAYLAFYIITHNFKKEFIKKMAMGLLFFVFFNLWCFLPFLHETLSTAINNQDKLHEAKELSIKWSKGKSLVLHENLRLMGAKGLSAGKNGELFYPSIQKYFNNPLYIFLSYLLSFIGFLSFLIFNKNKKVLFFKIIFILFAFFAIAQKFNLYSWAIENIPGFWLFRSPWQKSMNVLTLCFSIMFTTSIVYALKLFEKYKKRVLKYLLLGVFLILVLIQLKPFWNGEMYPHRTDKTKLQSAHINYPFPEYVNKTATFLNNDPQEFRGLLLPNTDRAVYSWGMILNSHLLPYLSSKAFLVNYYERSLNNAERLRDELVNLLYQSIDQEYLKITKLTSILNIKYIVQRNDLIYDYLNGKDSPEFVKEKLQNIKNISLHKKIGGNDIYLADEFLPKIYNVPSCQKINNASNIKELSKYITSSAFTPEKEIISSDPTSCFVNENKSFSPYIKFKKINPTHYDIEISNFKNSFYLVFLENFNNGWKLYTNNFSNIEELERVHANIGEGKHSAFKYKISDLKFMFKKPLYDDQHIRANGYANAWYIGPLEDEGNKKIKLTIYNNSQNYLYLGVLLSVTSIVLAGFAVFKEHKNKF